MSEGESGSFALVIRRGQVKVTKSGIGGRNHLLGVSGPGDLLGEMACLDRRERTASVTSLGDLHGSKVPSAAFLDLIDRRPGIAREVARVATSRLRAAHRLRVGLGTTEVVARVAYVLREAASAFPQTGGAGFTVPLSQDELAQLGGVSQVSVQRALRMLRRLRLADTGYRRVVVPCTVCLARFAAETRTPAAEAANSITGCGGRAAHPKR